MVNRQAWKNGLCVALLTGVAATQALAADPVLSVVAAPSPAVVGSPVTLNVLISGVTDLFGFQFTLSFNPALLQATTAAEGAFLGTGGTTLFGSSTPDNTLGIISVTYGSLIGALPGVSGSGTLASFSFNAVQAGTSALNFSEVILLNSALNDITTTVQNGSLQVSAIPEPATMLLFGLGLAGVAVRRRLAAA